jgi:biopolymer transport protein ExbB/TolQ
MSIRTTTGLQSIPSPLKHALHTLVGVRKSLRLGLLLPLPIILAAGITMVLANIFLLQNAFLAFFLAIIFLVFVAGQAVALSQLVRLRKSLDSTEKTIRALVEAGTEPDLQTLRDRLEEDVPEGLLRDLILRWTELGIRGSEGGYDTLLDDALDRRAIEDNRMLTLHATINRTTLKLGFLGTLIGIILTFPPMKRAVLGLSDSDGELKFIRDIALAIDGDQYAILSTLIATGLSILVEFVTIQLLERILHGLDMVQSDVNDWNAMCLQPAIARRREDMEPAAELEQSQSRMELALLQAQQTLERHLTDLTAAMHAAGSQLGQVIDIQAAVSTRLEELSGYERLAASMSQSQQTLERHLGGLTDALRISGTQLGQVADAQSLLSRRVTELTEYERQYRAFITAKQKSATPDSLRGER